MTTTMVTAIYVRRGDRYVVLEKKKGGYVRYYRRKNMVDLERVIEKRVRNLSSMKESTIGQYDFVMMARRRDKNLLPVDTLSWRFG